jgi:hypothetical protein
MEIIDQEATKVAEILSAPRKPLLPDMPESSKEGQPLLLSLQHLAGAGDEVCRCSR